MYAHDPTPDRTAPTTTLSGFASGPVRIGVCNKERAPTRDDKGLYPTRRGLERPFAAVSTDKLDPPSDRVSGSASIAPYQDNLSGSDLRPAGGDPA